jgi:hypothetical protein
MKHSARYASAACRKAKYGKEIKRLLVHIINILNFYQIMDKKELKFYEAPACEVVELKVESQLLAGSGIEGVDNPDDLNGGNDNPGF